MTKVIDRESLIIRVVIYGLFVSIGIAGIVVATLSLLGHNGYWGLVAIPITWLLIAITTVIAYKKAMNRND